ncbi:MAG: polysaccharide ABC transporter ATP-binding protein [Paludibacteraceae bacterium]|nr:polysaccharide ABC transporter ATP-binding protein [Paludibacteraceae bacterium]
MTAIEFNHVGKQYRLGLVSTGTLSHDINRWWRTSILGQEDPYLKIGDVNDRASKANSDYVWALRDIDFKVEEGDVVGIIGKNGAGKSTLLKLLSKVTAPTIGTIRARGRIASLLEVGTGFHGEMTGRENIYMNGAILGMTKAEIDRKMDEIIDFSGCEKYIDTPVKRYSSGMTVRLGFAVAAFLDPEILVVDEVLAVGDAEFQKKAIGKMKDVSQGQGRTVLFVSHNMTSVKSLCKTGVLLENGGLKEMGDIDPIVSHYLRGNSDIDNYKLFNEPFKGKNGFELLEIGVRPKGGQFTDVMRVTDELEIVMRYRLTQPHEKFWITLHMKNEQGERMFSTSGGGRCYVTRHDAGEYEQICHLPKDFFNWGSYSLDFLALSQPSNIEWLMVENDIVSFTLANRAIEIGGWQGREPGDITPKFEYKETKLN